MRISCPNCSATYDVPAELAAGRPVVRCVQCAQEWKLGQTPAIALTTPPPAPAPTLAPSAPTPPEPLLNPIPPELLGRPAEAKPAAETLEMDRATSARPEEDGEPAPLAAEIASQDLEAATVVPDEPVAPAAEAPPAVAAPASAPRTGTVSALRLALASFAGNLFAVTGWAISLGLLLALAWVAIQHRTGIMHAWPPSQRLFNWLGLA